MKFANKFAVRYGSFGAEIKHNGKAIILVNFFTAAGERAAISISVSCQIEDWKTDEANKEMRLTFKLNNCKEHLTIKLP